MGADAAFCQTVEKEHMLYSIAIPYMSLNMELSQKSLHRHPLVRPLAVEPWKIQAIWFNSQCRALSSHNRAGDDIRRPARSSCASLPILLINVLTTNVLPIADQCNLCSMQCKLQFSRWLLPFGETPALLGFESSVEFSRGV